METQKDTRLQFQFRGPFPPVWTECLRVPILEKITWWQYMRGLVLTRTRISVPETLCKKQIPVYSQCLLGFSCNQGAHGSVVC
jgi:hypothetical protein